MAWNKLFVENASGNITVTNTLTAADLVATTELTAPLVTATNAAITTLTAGSLAGPLTGNVVGNLTGDVSGNVSGNAGTVTNGVYTTGNQTINGVKTFSETIAANVTGNVSGNLTGDVDGDVTGDVTGNVAGNLTGSVLTASQTNITSVGPLTGLTLSGALNLGDLDGYALTGGTTDDNTKLGYSISDQHFKITSNGNDYFKIDRFNAHNYAQFYSQLRVTSINNLASVKLGNYNDVGLNVMECSQSDNNSYSSTKSLGVTIKCGENDSTSDITPALILSDNRRSWSSGEATPGFGTSLIFQAQTKASQNTNFRRYIDGVEIQSIGTDTTSGAEDFDMVVKLAVGGASEEKLRLTSAGILTCGGSAMATESYADTAVANLVDSAPAALDTLNELAAALGDDANFSTTVTNSIATKHPTIDASARLDAALIHDGTVTNTKFGYLAGVTSSIQTQFDQYSDSLTDLSDEIEAKQDTLTSASTIWEVASNDLTLNVGGNAAGDIRLKVGSAGFIYFDTSAIDECFKISVNERYINFKGDEHGAYYKLDTGNGDTTIWNEKDASSTGDGILATFSRGNITQNAPIHKFDNGWSNSVGNTAEIGLDNFDTYFKLHDVGASNTDGFRIATKGLSSGVTEITNGNADLTINLGAGTELHLKENSGTYTPSADTHVAPKKYVDDEIDAVDYNGTSGLLFYDEDDMAHDSAGGTASQQSIKAYVDGKQKWLQCIPFRYYTKYDNWYYPSTIYGPSYYNWSSTGNSSGQRLSHLDSWHPCIVVPHNMTLTEYWFQGNVTSGQDYEHVLLRGALPASGFGSAGDYIYSTVGAVQQTTMTASIQYKIGQSGLSQLLVAGEILCPAMRRTTADTSSTYYMEGCLILVATVN
jgi:hypothetical protein